LDDGDVPEFYEYHCITDFSNRKELASYVTPKLTTIDYSTSRWGRVATENLLHLLDEEKANHVKIDVKLAKGGSC